MRFSKPNIDLSFRDIIKIMEVFESGWVSIAKNMEILEEHFRNTFGVKYAIACSSCTQGLTIVLQAIGWVDRHIAVPVFTWPSTVYAIRASGNYPIFCDIHSDTWLIDPLTSKGQYDCIIPVDVFGNECAEYDMAVYDAAHGYGLSHLGKRGLAEVVSLSHTKPVTACEGGMILTNDDCIATRAKELRRLASRMGEINAVVAMSSISQYDKNKSIRKSIIRRYIDELDFEKTFQVIRIDTNRSVFAILLPSQESRDAIVNAFKKNDIEVKVYYEPIVKGFPVADNVFSRIIALPTYEGLNVDKIIEVANKA